VRHGRGTRRPGASTGVGVWRSSPHRGAERARRWCVAPPVWTAHDPGAPVEKSRRGRAGETPASCCVATAAFRPLAGASASAGPARQCSGRDREGGVSSSGSARYPRSRHRRRRERAYWQGAAVGHAGISPARGTPARGTPRSRDPPLAGPPLAGPALAAADRTARPPPHPRPRRPTAPQPHAHPPPRHAAGGRHSRGPSRVGGLQ
jgi:hypothetical protein